MLAHHIQFGSSAQTLGLRRGGHFCARPNNARGQVSSGGLEVELRRRRFGNSAVKPDHSLEAVYGSRGTLVLEKQQQQQGGGSWNRASMDGENR